ncbi:MAG: Pantothenate precursors transporter PanS [Alphaproteobacteria bacterium MarineAlpha6_Bin4]|nr:MAG: Pantothenate precursors transporter PanS [Alphaproteobacteria bacterium MarineAlpha6_Bin3]PPR37220.1 MAG: Pantothenate precursors transporter PanS [Alphaproteobacteria bacterium MarineAlpha6_Bin4]|tara:strand:- start:8938 stop:9852 length:915 start_codon:yes stop_codon:yes gene_type:complete
MKQFVSISTNLFPLWIIIFSFCAFLQPQYWANLTFLIIPLLSLVMFSMGLTLKLENFLKIFKNFKILCLGIFLQFMIMPILGFTLVKFFNIEQIIGIGIILVGCAPGGTASNVICYLARGDVALSISLTIVSTILAVFFMPLLFLFYTGSSIEIPVYQMMFSIFKIVVIPVFLGVVINSIKSIKLEKIKLCLPLIAVLAIVVIVTIIIGSNSEEILEQGPRIFFIVVLHNLLGIFIGFYFCRKMNYSKKISKTLAIEIGMQNSGLATALAIKYFGSLAGLAGAFFSIWHNISGPILAIFWKKRN